MKLFGCVLLLFLIVTVGYCKDCPTKRINSKLICYYSQLTDVDGCYCTHVVLPANSDFKSIDNVRQKLAGSGAKILLTVTEFNQGLVETVEKNDIDGLEIKLQKLDSKNDISEFIGTIRSRLGNDLYVSLSIPARTDLLAKYYDLKQLSKSADLFVLQTAFLGASKNTTFHPSRLSGLWDMQNTDSVVDLVTGMGAPLSKLAITAPVQAFQFKLQDKRYTTPGSPALELKSLSRDELCIKMGSSNNWTLERDQDQAGPYIFRENQWISFEDPISMDIKAKYARVRGLAGLALKDLSMDGGVKCGGSLLEAAHTGLAKQTRAPRGAVLRSLEREILETPARPLDTINVSPFRISRVIDVEGHVHTIRKDTRTEFTCSRQGYFVHPHSCGRFYRCVKFDQQTDEYSVFEFDCPAGLAFDSRWEVCVWPGSLPHGTPCSGSSEIAPVPRERFACPSEPGYYADPENCRWFFACLDHGRSGLTAYEFRCPFGLVYDEKRLLCEWPWLVPSCANGHYGLELGTVEFYGGIAGASSIGLGTIGVQQNQHHLAHALDTYDGLGALGALQLGGYHGNLDQFGKLYGVGTYDGSQFGASNVHYESGASGADAHLIGATVAHGSGFQAGSSQSHLSQAFLVDKAASLNEFSGSEHQGSLGGGFLTGQAVSQQGLHSGTVGKTSFDEFSGSLLNQGSLGGGFLTGQAVSQQGLHSGTVGKTSLNEFSGSLLNQESLDAGFLTGQAVSQHGLHSGTVGKTSLNEFSGSLLNQGSIGGGFSTGQAVSQQSLHSGTVGKTSLNEFSGSLLNQGSLGGEFLTEQVVSQQGLHSGTVGKTSLNEFSGSLLNQGSLGSGFLTEQVVSQQGLHSGTVGKTSLNEFSGSLLNQGSLGSGFLTGQVVSQQNLHSGTVGKTSLNEFSGSLLNQGSIGGGFSTGQAVSQQSLHSGTVGKTSLNEFSGSLRNQGSLGAGFLAGQAVSQDIHSGAAGLNLELINAGFEGTRYNGHVDNQNFADLKEKTLLHSGAAQEYDSNLYLGNVYGSAGAKSTYDANRYQSGGGLYAKYGKFGDILQSYGSYGKVTPGIQYAIPQKNIYSGHADGSYQNQAKSSQHITQTHSGVVYNGYDDAYGPRVNGSSNYGAQYLTVTPKPNLFTEIKYKTPKFINVHISPQYETVAPKYESIHFGTAYQDVKSQPKIETVSVAPILGYQTFEAKQKEQVYVAPKIEPALDLQYHGKQPYGTHGSSYQTVAFETKLPVVQKNVYVAPEVETVSIAPAVHTYDTGSSYQSVAFETKTPQDAYVAPKLESVSIVPSVELQYQKEVYVAPKTVSVAPIGSTYDSGSSYQSVSFQKAPQKEHVYVAPVAVQNTYDTQYGSHGSSYQSVSFETKPVVAPKIETVSVAPVVELDTYGTHGSSYQSNVYVAPKVETVSVAPVLGVQYNTHGVSFETKTPVQKHVYVAPKIETLAPVAGLGQQNGYASHGSSYQSVAFETKTPSVQKAHVYVAPKIETVSVAPVVQYHEKQGAYDSQHNTQGGSYQSVSFETKAPVVQEQIYVAPKVETVSVAPVNQNAYATHGSSYQSVAFETKPLVQKAHVYVAPKVETVSVAPVVQYHEKQDAYGSKYNTQGGSYQSVSFETKAPVVQEQVYVAPKVETVLGVQYHGDSHGSQYKTQGTGYQSVSFGTKPVVHEQVYVAPKVETVAPVVELGKGSTYTSHGSSYQSVTYGTKSPQTQHVYVAPKVETASFAPVENTYDSQYNTHGASYQSVSFETKQEYVAPKVETVSVAPTYESKGASFQSISFGTKAPVVETHYTKQYDGYAKQGKSFQSVSFETKAPAYVAPVAQTTYEQPKVHVQHYEETYQNIQPQVETVASKYYQTPIASSTIKYDTYSPKAQANAESYQFVPQKTVLNIKQESREYLPPQTPQTVYISSTPKPVKTVTAAPVVYETYSLQTPKETVVNLKPTLSEETVYISTTPKPQRYNIYREFSQPAYVAPKAVHVSSTPKYNVFQEYVQPKVTYPAPKPVTYVSSTVKPVTYVSSTPKYEIYQEYAQPLPTVSYRPKTVTEEYFVSSTPKYQEKVVVSSPRPFVAKQEYYAATTPKYNVLQEYAQKVAPTVVSEFKYENNAYKYNQQESYRAEKVEEVNANYDYDYDSNHNFKFVQQPKETVYYSTEKPASGFYIKAEPKIKQDYVALKNYQTDYIVSTPKPTIYSTIAPVVKQTARVPTKVVAVNKYVVTTPKPIYIASTTPVYKPIESVSNLEFYDAKYDILLNTPVAPIEVSSAVPIPSGQRKKVTTESLKADDIDIRFSTPAPGQYLKETTFDAYNDYDKYVVTTFKPKATIRPVVVKKKLVTTTTSPVIVSTTAIPVARKKIVSTPAPTERYYIKTRPVEITPKPKAKTIVRVNDFHPLLTTKLGAQCTCISNTVQLRKKSKQISQSVNDYENLPVTKITTDGPATYDDYNEPGIYVVGNSDNYYDDDYEPKKIDVESSTPEVISTTNAIQPAPTPVYTIKRKKITTAPIVEVTSAAPRYTSATTADELFLRRSKSKEEKIAETVKEGLTLVKSAIKGYVKEAVHESIQDFDRYGPGGVRGRDERLQGTVDCQREGLFRHPTQCNKFYACHWDCKKNKYTLHVFNCPIHLTFDSTMGACNWPSKGPACSGNTLLPAV